MKRNKTISSLLWSLAAAVVLVSCSEDKMDKINEDPNNPTPDKVAARYMFTNTIVSNAVNLVGGNPSFYAACYMEHEVGIYNQLYNAEQRQGEPYNSSTYNNEYMGTYANINTLKIIIAKCSQGGAEEGNVYTLGAAQVMLAYQLAYTTDLWGNVPWTEACDLAIFQPKLDTQESIYVVINKLLDDAIVNLTAASSKGAALGSQDFLYGSASKNQFPYWVKFAYGLKARYAMRLSERVAPNYDAILGYISKSFASPTEEAKVTIFDGMNYISPWGAFFDSRDYFALSESYNQKMVARNDPRGVVLPATQDALKKHFGKAAPGYTKGYAKSGDPLFNGQKSWGIGYFSIAFAAPVYFMSYHELKFIEAEVLAAKGDLVGAETALKAAIVANFAKWQRSYIEVYGEDSNKLTDASAAAYYASGVKTLFDANPIKEIMTQKYLALYTGGEDIECYNDYRRIQSKGYYTLTNAQPFPLRFIYGGDAITANPNFANAIGGNYSSFVNDQKVWWAGGTK